MPNIKRSATVPYTAEEMYNLVNRVEEYPAFLPWCKSSLILSRKPEEVRATLTFARGKLEKSFTTCNRLHKNKMIEMRLIDGPFKHLEGFWRFEAIDENHTGVMLDLSYEFANRLLDLSFGHLFQAVANSLVTAFCKQAIDTYGYRN